MAPKITYTAQEQKILKDAVEKIDSTISNEYGDIQRTSGTDCNCLIHATLGTKNNNNVYFMESHQDIRKFLFQIVTSFSDADMDNSNVSEELKDLIYELARVTLQHTRKIQDQKGWLTYYRDTLCNFDKKSQKNRFLNDSEAKLLAILANAYILNWTRDDDSLILKGQNVFSPNPELRELLIAHIKSKNIEIPKAISDCDNMPIRAIHIENSNNIHFSRVQWSKDQINDSITVPAVDNAINLYNTKLNRNPKKEADTAANTDVGANNSAPQGRDSPKPDDAKKPDGANKPAQAKKPAVIPPKPEAPKSTPNPVKGVGINFQKKLESNITKIDWTDKELKKIYRNNINYLLHMMAQDAAAKTLFLNQLQGTPRNAIVLSRSSKNEALFYTKIHHTIPQNISALLIENITAYEHLKSNKQSDVLKQYQDLKTVVEASSDDTTVLDDSKTEAFKSHAYVRTNNKQTYLLDKTIAKIQSEAHQDPLAMLHLKKEDSISKPTNYHMVGLGDLATAAKWINEDMPKEAHILKAGSLKYRLYLRQHPQHPEQYQMFKCEVDDKGVYKTHAKAETISPADEALWSNQIQGIFEAYSKYKHVKLHKAGFKPGQQ